MFTFILQKYFNRHKNGSVRKHKFIFDQYIHFRVTIIKNETFSFILR